MEATDGPIVLAETAEGVCVVTLNRPDRRNGWSPELEAAYLAALDRCEDDDEVRAVVVTGGGRYFCPGLDLTGVCRYSSRALDVTGLPKVPASGVFLLPGRAPQYRPRRFRKPLIAAING